MKYTRYLSLLMCLLFSSFAFSSGEQCQGGDSSVKNTIPRYCFFSLNGKDESEGVCEAIRKAKGEESASKDKDFCENLPQKYGIEVKEYYSELLKAEGVKEGNHVEKAFREMTKDRCDALVISGHHVGYFTGSKQKDRSSEYVALTLDFLEKFSCHEDENCQAWFNNVKMLQLHGSRTWGDKDGNTMDRASNLINEYPDTVGTDIEILYREYASTVDENNPISHRYLRMFPQAAVLGWSHEAPEIRDSIASFIAYLKNLGAQQKDDSDNLERGLDKFVNFLTSSNNVKEEEEEEICQAWEDVWYAGTESLSKSEYNASSDKDLLAADRKKGCALSQAIARNEGVEEALDAILNNDDGEASVRVHQNLNRIINAIHPKSELSMANKEAIIEKLKESDTAKDILAENINNEELGLVRRADHLALYKHVLDRMDGELNYGERTALSHAEINFFRDLSITAKDNNNIEADQCDDFCKRKREVTAKMLGEVVWKNRLGFSYLGQGDVEKQIVESLVEDINNTAVNESFTTSELAKHSLLVRLSLFINNPKSIDNKERDALLQNIDFWVNRSPTTAIIDDTLLRSGISHLLGVSLPEKSSYTLEDVVNFKNQIANRINSLASSKRR